MAVYHEGTDHILGCGLKTSSFKNLFIEKFQEKN